MNTTQLRFPSNRIRDIERQMHKELHFLYPNEEIDSFFQILVQAFLGWDKAQWLLHRDQTINQSDLLQFHWAIEDLLKERPIQYITGTTCFCGLQIHVDERVLIPRPETAEMVDSIIRQYNIEKRVPYSILDLCTGSGCIAIVLKNQFPESKVTATDLSVEALDVAKENAKVNQANIDFRHEDLLHRVENDTTDTYDLIVSNPPYVMEHERQSMNNNVLHYEPATALFVPDSNPLQYYEAIASIAAHSLNKDGKLFVEINEQLGALTAAVLQRHHFDTVIHQDFLGKDRYIEASRTTA